MSDRTNQLAEHLRFLESLGVTGVSRDPQWTTRPGAAPPDRAEDAAQPGGDLLHAVHDAGHLETGYPAPVPGVPVSVAARADVPSSLDPLSSGQLVAGGTAAVVGPSQPTIDPARLLVELKTEIGDCTRCKLHGLGRRQVVFGVGNPHARLMFVGEAPGQDEDIQGIPFVGRAGQLLTKMIEAIGMTRDEVYIANVIKCRPPGNRNPEPDEVATCEPFLFRQIDTIGPKVVVALGKFAAQALLRSKEPISKLRGPVYQYRGASLVVTFHPAFLLRSPGFKREAWEDLKKVRVILGAG